jgi:hypothetical protein
MHLHQTGIVTNGSIDDDDDDRHPDIPGCGMGCTLRKVAQS